MTYISRNGSPLTNLIEIVDDVFKVGVSQNKDSISLIDSGIFCSSIQKNNLTPDNLLSSLYDFIERSNNYWGNFNIKLLPTIKSIDKVNEQEVTIIFTIECIHNDRKQEVLTYRKTLKVEE